MPASQPASQPAMATAGADDRVARRLASPVRKWRHPRVSVTFDWNAENMRGRYEGRVQEAGGRRNGARLLAAGAGAPDPVLQFQSRRLSISLSEAQQIAQGAEGSSRSTHTAHGQTTDDRRPRTEDRLYVCIGVSRFCIARYTATSYRLRLHDGGGYAGRHCSTTHK